MRNFSQDKQIQMLYSWIKAKGYEPIGPLIMYSSAVKGVDSENKPIIESRIMVQLKQNKTKLEAPYRFQNEIRIENCLFARFNDNAGETYIVLIKQEESCHLRMFL